MTHRVPYIARNWPLAVLVPVTLGYLTGDFRLAIVCAYLLSSAVSIFLYRSDKISAQREQWRIPERYLHIWAFLCGWPGAIIGQKTFHHKTCKISFRLVFYISVIANIIAISFLIYYFTEYNLH